MTDAEQELRAYVAAVNRAQQPVELGEVVARRRRRPRSRVVAGASAFVCFALVAGAIVVEHDRRGGQHLVVAPPSSSSIPTTPQECPAASLVVTGTSGERLHPAWLPPGYALTEGNETVLGERGNLTYTTAGTGDRPRVEILRYDTAEPLTRIFEGTARPLVVQGHEGILSVGVPMPTFVAVLWRPDPRIAIVVNGYKLDEAELVRIADNVQYETGSTFTYPTHPTITVTRGQALAALPASGADAHAVLTSFGELDAVAKRAELVDPLPARPGGASVIEPVWVAWTSDGSATATAVLVDAQDAQMRALPNLRPRNLESLTDRSIAGCAPPFGVLTRTEASFLRAPAFGPGIGGALTMKLAAQATLESSSTFAGMAQCFLNTCDPSVPVWLIIRSAPDQRFTALERGLGRPPTNTQPGSWSLTALDARTGPQDTNFGASLGSGPPPADILAVTDLAPER